MRSAIFIMLLLARSTLAAEDPPAIPLVRTWKELSSTPAITLTDGQKVHVGIEALSAPAGSYVMLHVLNDSKMPEEYMDRDMGPLTLRIDPDPTTERNRAGGKRKQTDTHVFNLWCAAVGVKEKPVKITLLEGDRVVAAATLTANERVFHPWMSLLPPDARTLKEVYIVDRSVVDLSTGGAYIAVALVGKSKPITMVAPEKLESTEPLPHLLTTDDEEFPALALKDPGALIQQLACTDFETRETAAGKFVQAGAACLPLLKARLKDCKDAEAEIRLNSIIDRLEGDLQARISDGHIQLKFPYPVMNYRSKNNFMGRWWLNGKPIAPANRILDQLERETSGPSEVVDEMTLNLQIDWAQLGAKTGDIVTVQIMHTPDGYVEKGKSFSALSMEYGAEEIDRRPRVSNKLTFTAP